MKILVNGAAGRMGTVLIRLLQQRWNGFEPAGAADTAAKPGSGICTALEDCPGPADALIDFSHPDAAPSVCRYAAAHRLPLVIATTGHSVQQKELIMQTARSIPLLYAANVSPGITLLRRFACEAAAQLPDCAAEIVEVHRRDKLDAPSGTALELARCLQKMRPDASLRCGRNGHSLCAAEEIGLHSLRLAEVNGTHAVIFAGEAESFYLIHAVHTPELYAKSALNAAALLRCKAAGLYAAEQLFCTAPGAESSREGGSSFP